MEKRSIKLIVSYPVLEYEIDVDKKFSKIATKCKGKLSRTDKPLFRDDNGRTVCDLSFEFESIYDSNRFSKLVKYTIKDAIGYIISNDIKR